MKLLIKIILLLLISICAVSSPSYSQTAILRGITAKDGLSGSIVYALCKDSHGFIWIATDKGVNRFDGYHIKACNGFSGKAVKTMTISKNGSIIAGNMDGLWQYDANKDTFFPVFRSEVSAEVYCLLSDNNGQLLAGTSKGIYIQKRNRWKHILIDRNVFSRNNRILGITKDDKGLIWIVGETGVYTINPITKEIRTILRSEPKFYNCITYFHGKVYIGTRNDGVLYYDMKSRTTKRIVDTETASVKALVLDPSRQMLYAGTDGSGVFLISTATNRISNVLRSETGIENTLRSNSVYSLLIDKEGILWVGYFQMGLDYTLYQNGLFTLYNFPAASFTSYQIPVRAIAIHGSQRVIGSRDGLYFIDEDRQDYRHYTTPQLASNMIFCIIYYQNRYIIGTSAGLYQLNPDNGNLQPYNLPGTKGKDELFFSLMQDRDGSLWAGTTTGLFRFKDGKQTDHFQPSNSQLPGNIIYRIYEDSEKRVWIVTDNGMCIYEPSTRTIHTDLFPPSFPWKTLKNITEERDGTLCFITAAGTLLTASSDLKDTKPLLPELFKDGTKCSFISEDNKGGLWIGTDNGLFCRDHYGYLHTYTFIDGIPDPTFFSCLPIIDEKGQLWFGNSQGLLKWNGYYDVRSQPYRIQVTDVLVNNHSLGREVLEDKSIHLSSSKEELTFYISDLSYTDPSSVVYEYCLEGYNDKWKKLKGSSELTFYNLSSGSYTLKIRKAGVPSSEVQIPVSIGISWWLIVLALGITGIICIRIISLRWHIRPWKLLKFGRNRLKVQSSIPEEQSEDLSEKYRNNKVDEESCVILSQKLESLMREKKMYLNPELKLKDMADKLGVPVYNLSYVLNIYMHQRFNDYVNNFRVDSFKALVMDEKYRLYTLDALSVLCGFSSKTSFFRNFKRREQITPSEYIRRISTKE